MKNFAPAHRMSCRQGGFTLAELLVTVVILAIVTAIGLPMLRGFIDDAGVSTAADQMLASLNYTRSEAVKRNTRVTMCRSGDGASCAVAAATGDWRAGWIVFVDGADPAQLDGGDQVLRVQHALSDSSRLLAAGALADYVSYASNGQARLSDGSAQAGVFTACAASADTRRRRIALTAGTGWVGVAIVAASASCTS